jgi:hypothetical protein
LQILGEADSIRALTIPAEQFGRPFEPAAAQLLNGFTGGYPYAIQVYGFHAWEATQGEEAIGTGSIKQAIQDANRQMEDNVYRQRWQQSASSERRYMAAVASLLASDQATTGGDVANYLGTSTRKLSSYRARLIEKGNLILDGSMMRFPVPGMAKYVLDKASEDSIIDSIPDRSISLYEDRFGGLEM